MPTFVLLLSVFPQAWPVRGQSANQNAAVTGEFTVERPTLMSAGFDWNIQGDDNRTATVEVTYRKAGTQAWKQALPLLRLQHEQVKRALQQIYIVIVIASQRGPLSQLVWESSKCSPRLSRRDAISSFSRSVPHVRSVDA